MILEHIKLQGFLSFVDEEVDFRNGHIILIAGPNGQGKSSLLESVPWCYWGKGRGKTLSDFVNDRCDTVKVDVTFIQDNVRYKKVRQSGKKGSINELYIDTVNKDLEQAKWKLISDDTKRKTDDLLSEVIGLDYDIFSNSVFFGQKEASSFVEGGASERKELLCNLLGVQIYEDAESEAKKQLNEIDNKIQVKQVVINDKKRIVEQKDDLLERYTVTKKNIKSNKKQIEDIEERLNELYENRESLKIKIENQKKNKEQIVSLNDQIQKLKAHKKQYENDIVQIQEDLQTTKSQQKDELEEYDTIIESRKAFEEEKEKNEKILNSLKEEKEKIPELKERFTAQLKAKEKLVQQESTCDTQIEVIQKKINKIESAGPICPITELQCSSLSKENKTQTINELKKEQQQIEKSLKQVVIDLKTVRDTIVSLDGEITNLNKKVNNESKIVSVITSLEKDIKQVDVAEAKLPQIKEMYQKKLEKLRDSEIDLKDRKEKIEKDIVELIDKKNEIEKNEDEDFEEQLTKLVRSITVNKEDLTELQEQQKQLNVRIGQLKNSLEQIESAENDIKIVQDEIDELGKLYRIYTELSLAFGKNGIQKDIIGNVVPLLESFTNDLLSKFTKNSDFRVKFDLDPMTKGLKLKKGGGLDIIISNANRSPKLLNMYSGGETVRIVFAILLSLSNLLTSRAGKKSQTLIIDERVAALDDEGINQFIEIVKCISNQYKKILVVSHIDKLKDAFTEQLLVTKDNDAGSKISDMRN